MVFRVEQIGGCTLYLADALAILATLNGGSVDHTFTDPPYSSGGMTRGDRTSKTGNKYASSESRHLHADFSGDNKDQRSFGYWSALWMSEALRVTRPGGLGCVFTDWRQLPTTTDALQAGGWVWRGIVVWDKTLSARPQKGRFRNQSEYVAWGSNGPMADDGPCAPGVFTRPVSAERKSHQAGKPIHLLTDMLQLVRPGETILDPFMGSGSTGVACARRRLKFVGIEINEVHFETACRRIADAYLQPREAGAGEQQEALL
jgi:site-specific DNA-methyltransferase (adenine-specific)